MRLPPAEWPFCWHVIGPEPWHRASVRWMSVLSDVSIRKRRIRDAILCRVDSRRPSDERRCGESQRRTRTPIVAARAHLPCSRTVRDWGGARFVDDGASPNLPQRHFAIKRPHFDTVEGFRRRRPPLTTFDSSMRRPFAHGHQHAAPVRACAGVRRFLGLPSSFSALPSPIRRAVPNLRPSEPDAKLGTLKTR